MWVVRSCRVVRPRGSIAGDSTATTADAPGNYHDVRSVVEEPAQPEKTTVFGGVAVTNISDDIRTTLNLPKEIQGAVIADIDAESPAAKSGLREGDVIQEVNKQPVKSAKDLLVISKKLKPNDKILMRVYSQGRSGYVALEPK